MTVIEVSIVGLTILALPLVGLLRAKQLIFSASISKAHESLRFFGEHSTLTQIVLVILTIIIPLMASFALIYSINGLGLAWEWRNAKRQNERLPVQMKVLAEKIKAAEAEREDFLGILEARHGEKAAQAQDNYKLGITLANWFGRFWRSIFICLGIVLLVGAACFALDPLLRGAFPSLTLRVIAYCCAALGIALLYAAYTFKEPPNASTPGIASDSKSESPLPTSERAVVQVPMETGNSNGSNRESRL